jgi:hypothetical protein
MNRLHEILCSSNRHRLVPQMIAPENIDLTMGRPILQMAGLVVKRAHMPALHKF